MTDEGNERPTEPPDPETESVSPRASDSETIGPEFDLAGGFLPRNIEDAAG